MKNQFGQNTNENISKISALEVYYFKVNTKRESMFCLQEDRLCFVEGEQKKSLLPFCRLEAIS